MKTIAPGLGSPISLNKKRMRNYADQEPWKSDAPFERK